MPHFQSLHPLPASNWHPSSCCLGAEFQWGLLCMSPESVKGHLRRVSESCSFFHCPNPHCFYSHKLWGFIFWSWNAELGGLDWGWNHLLPRYPSHFLSTTSECGTTHSTAATPLRACPPVSASLPLLPIWMNVTSLILWLSDIHTVQFSDSCGCYLFCSLVAIFAVVVQGGKLCLPRPPP